MEILFFIAILMMSVIIHELSHGYVASFLGDPTARLAGRLTLNPIAHLDPVGSVIVPLFLSILPGGFIFGWARPVPFNPYNLKAGRWGPALVAIAGPVSNLFLAFIFGVIIRLSVENLSPVALMVLSQIVLINLVLAIFNSLPIPPLDGSKILFALLPYSWRSVETWLTRYWILIVLAVVFFGGVFIITAISFLFELLTDLPFKAFFG
ncbi:MAG: site-2 protease family protein [Patescibacteria group bacterium]